ncbi:nucleolar complex protein 3 homolog [Clavelina lepadiformis]|uniref:nucleolar complex protein 3 homolog n=1 Tax=Clavelina lepadiformis TaxID=159417 RepID=UPI0040417452
MVQRKRKNARDRPALGCEENFEKRPRLFQKEILPQKNGKIRNLLPIKESSGKFIPQTYEEQEVLDHQEDYEDSKTIEKSVEKTLQPARSKEELLIQRRKLIVEKKEKIALLSSSIVADPQSSLKMIKELRLMLEDRDTPESFVTIHKLVIASLACLFVDIIPGYRIRERTEKEKEVKLSKDVKELTDYEEGLLHHYQLYLKSLEKFIKYRKNPGKYKLMSPDAAKSLGKVATHSLSQLYAHTAHFNFHANVTLVLIPLANNDPDCDVRKTCCEAISTLFSLDKNGNSSLNTVKAIANVAKEVGPKKLNPEFLNTLLCLRIKVVDYSMVGIAKNKEERKKMKEEKKKLSRRKKKESKIEQDKDQELKELAASEDQEERTKIHTEIVQQIFLIYFRILKHENGGDCRTILPSILEGLAKFAHLINIDFFNDLLNVLQQLVSSGTLSHRENLHCIYAAFQILSGQGEVLNIDPIEFYKIAYKIILEMASESNTEHCNVELLLKCLDVMLNKRRKQVTLLSLCAFVKRLSMLGMQLTSTGKILQILKQVGRLLNSNSRTNCLFDVESLALGSYNPEVNDPLHSGAQSTNLWELHLMRRHYVSVVSRSAENLLKRG